MRRKDVNLIGLRFGRLLVQNRTSCTEYKEYDCLCDCGNIKAIRSSNLLSGSTKSCGCLQEEVNKTKSLVHGMSHTPTHRSWSAMFTRCYDPNFKSYSDYGGKGIRVCERWSKPSGEGFLNFLTDMGERPDLTYSIDRIDINGDYAPENCRWANKTVQSVNRGMLKNNTSGVTGVNFNYNKWVARISVNGKRISLGRFEHFEDAVSARQAAEIKYEAEIYADHQ